MYLLLGGRTFAWMQQRRIIGRQGNGPGEYARFINFTVGENDEVVVYDLTKRNVMKYDPKGHFIDSKESLFGARDIVCLSNSQYMLSLNALVNDNANKKVILTKDFQKSENSVFSYPEGFVDSRMNINVFQPFEDKIAYMYPVNDTLFVFDRNGALKQAWFFDFGAKRLESSLKNDYENVVKEERAGRLNGIYISETPICLKNYIFATIKVNGQPGILVYDTAKDKMSYELLSIDTFSLQNINVPMCNVSDSFIASYFDIDTYMFVKDKVSLSPEISAHLEAGGTIITLFSVE